ncbi:hypothetical protein D3C86_1850660 [compost metagenome]
MQAEGREPALAVPVLDDELGQVQLVMVGGVLEALEDVGEGILGALEPAEEAPREAKREDEGLSQQLQETLPATHRHHDGKDIGSFRVEKLQSLRTT